MDHEWWFSLSLKRKQSTSSSWLGKNFDEANCKDIKRERSFCKSLWRIDKCCLPIKEKRTHLFPSLAMNESLVLPLKRMELQIPLQLQIRKLNVEHCCTGNHNAQYKAITTTTCKKQLSFFFLLLPPSSPVAVGV
jgi:hypothetical protein